VKAYIRIDPLIDERKGHYSPAQLGAYMMVLCKAARQEPRGRFRSEQALRNMVPAPFVRHLAWLYDQGDVVVDDDGSVFVDGWDEWQEGDLTVADRMSRLRNRRRNAGVTPTVTQPYRSATHIDTDIDIDVRGIENLPSPLPPDGIFDAYYSLTARPPSPGAVAWLDRLSDEYPEDDVTAAMAAEWTASPNPSDFLGRVQTRLLSDERRRQAAADELAKERAKEERRRIESMPREQRAANQERMANMLKEAGLT